MMRPILWLDAALQRGFDRIFVPIMEWGVPKRHLRYALWCLFMALFFLTQLSWIMSGEVGKIGVSLLLCGLYIWLYGGMIENHRQRDEEAERRGMVSYADMPILAFSLKSTAIVFAVSPFCHLLEWLMIGRGLEVLRDHAQAMHALVTLALGYLCGTPPRPPRAKKRVQVLRRELA